MEGILENDIKKEAFYLFYEMMILSLQTDDVIEGINKSLYLLKTHLNSGDILLHRKNEAGVYVHHISQMGMEHQIKPISCVVNTTRALAESKGIFKLELDLSDNFKNMILIHIKTHFNEFILSINNAEHNKNDKEDFFEKLQETMSIILKRAEMYERNTRAITTDLLTGLDNRNSYETRIKELNANNTDLVFAIFDLFRLKHINDNYTHAVGDNYIKAAASILKKYWPKETKRISEKGIEEVVLTGHSVYRVGGDEFVLLTNRENIELTKIKASLAAEEVSMIDLGIDDKPIIGLNYGVISHECPTSIKQTYQNADRIMSDDKIRMYKKYNLERRK